MAAIDKIYAQNWEQYIQFKEWCEKQPSFKDKYGVSCNLTDYVVRYSHPWENTHPVFIGPYYLDAYLIRNCPLDFIQEELMINYGYYSECRIKELYQWMKDGNETWVKESDFKVHDDGTITMPCNEDSDYSQIKNGLLYTNPFTAFTYTIGRHFKCIKQPLYKYNRPYKCNGWFIEVQPPREFGYMWYHSNHNSWDFCDEFVISKWSSSTANVTTIKALKRLIVKWKLPVGTIVKATGRYVQDTYQFKVTK